MIHAGKKPRPKRKGRYRRKEESSSSEEEEDFEMELDDDSDDDVNDDDDEENEEEANDMETEMLECLQDSVTDTQNNAKSTWEEITGQPSTGIFEEPMIEET